jgi:predicted transcriptional regulator
LERTRLEISPSLRDSRNFKYRDRVSIIGDILMSIKNSAEKGKKKTQIMQSANLNYDQANKYLALMISNDYIREENTPTRRERLFKATSKGLNFIEILESENLTLR